MEKLIITADLHGNYTSWLIIKSLLRPGDILVIAGDLFDNRYGDFSDPDFRPDHIRNELLGLHHRFYYVYGNCDNPSFFPGFSHEITFKFLGKTIRLLHGHRPIKTSTGDEIIIQGHTHLYSLEKKGSGIMMNPGSLPFPRNGISTYGIIEKNSADIIELNTGKKLISIK